MTDDEISIQFATYAERDLDWPSGGFFKRLCNAVVAIGHALLAIHVELRRSNEARDAFYTEVLDLLVRITEDPFEGPSGAGAAAQVVEKEGP